MHDVAVAGTPAPGFDPLVAGQKVAADISAYLVTMNVDPGLLGVLAQYDSANNEIDYMTPVDMARFRVTTANTTRWAVTDLRGNFLVAGYNSKSAAVPGLGDQVDFACLGNPKRAKLVFYFLSEDDKDNQSRNLGTGAPNAPIPLSPAMFVAQTRSYTVYGVAADGSMAQQITASSTRGNPVVQPDAPQFVAVGVSITPALVGIIDSSARLGISFALTNPGRHADEFDLASGRQPILDLIANCH